MPAFDLPPAFFWIVTATVGLAGLCIGSFLNVCAWRIPRGESIVFPGSHCPKCGHAIGALENIPVLSWLCLGGKCRHCREPISWRYPLGELVTAALWLLLWFTGGWTLQTAWNIVWATALLLGAMIDCEHYILPDRITYGGLVAGLLVSLLAPQFQGVPGGLAWPPAEPHLRALGIAAMSAALGAGILWLVGVAGKAAFKKNAMGLGDVKLLAAVGACQGWQAVLFTVFVSSFSGTLLGLALMAAGKRKLAGRIPYGPHLAFGAVLWMLCGPACVDAYVRLALGLGGGAP